MLLLLVRREVLRIFRFGKWWLFLVRNLVWNWIGWRFGFGFGRMNDDESEHEIGIMFLEEMGMRMEFETWEVLYNAREISRNHPEGETCLVPNKKKKKFPPEH